MAGSAAALLLRCPCCRVPSYTEFPMRALRPFAFGGLVVSLLFAGIGCGKRTSGGGSSVPGETKTIEITQNQSSTSDSTVKPQPATPTGSGRPFDILRQPKIVPSLPPDWTQVGKQEWGPNEKLILSAEDAQNYVPGTLRISPDGGRFAYARKFTGGEAMFVDGKELMRLQSVNPKLIEFSRDSKHLVYAGYKSDEERHVWVRDNEVNLVMKAEGFTNSYAIQWFAMTPDASEIGCSADGYAIARGKYVGYTRDTVFSASEKLHYAILSPGSVNVDGTPQKKFESISGFQFSENGANFAYIVTQSGEQFVVFGKSEERPYQKVDSLVLSPDGKRYAHRAEHEGKQYLIIEGKPKAYTGNFKRGVLFSPDSSRWATILDNKVIVDHAADQEREGIDPNSLTFSPDSKHYAYFAKDTTANPNRSIVVLDGKVLGLYDAVARAPLFSSDSQSMTFLAQDGGKWSIYINDRKHATVPHDPQGRWILEFSPDSRSIGYAASVDLNWHILLDGKLIEKNEPIGAEGTRIGFGPDGSFTYVVKRKNAYYFVSEKRKS